MSKKLLALLVAVSTCCAFGCSDDDSDSCKTGEKRCDGNNAQICVNGNWSKGTPCADGCDKATGVCRGACKTAGEKRCSGKQLQECKDGNWSKLKDCKDSCDEATKACKDGGSGTIPEVGSPCDKSTFQQVCINGGANALVCWNDVVTKWNCANNDCKANAEKPLQVICAKGDTQPTTCTGEKVTTGGAVGTCCDKDTYQQTCIDGNAHALVCWDGAVTQWNCANNQCSANTEKPLQVVCAKGESKPTETTCTGEKVTTGGAVGTCCDKDTYQQTCTDGNAHALVCWDGAVKQWNCANNDCKANTEKPLQVVCAKGESKPTETTCTGEKVTTGGAVGTCCDKDTYQQTCTDGNAHALVCWDGAVKQWNCANNDCKANTEKPLQVVCAKGDSEPGTTQCNGDPKESGGAVGDCCNKDKYAPDCTGMLRCSNGVIKAISCKDGKSCKLNTDGTCSVESGNYCKDGKYDKTKYPLGYFECV